MLTIRHCQAADVPDVLTFLDTHWKPGHIFTVDRSLFDWQHARRDRPGEYSIAIARRQTDDAIVGVLGYIPTRHFDPALAGDNTLWLALWKVREDIESAGLGLRLVKYVMGHEPHTSVGVMGFNPAVRPIYQALGFGIGELQHYVLPNPDVETFELALFQQPRCRPTHDGGLTATAVNEATFASRAVGLDLSTRDGQVPRKTPAYFRARYLQHPTYRYACFVVGRGLTPGSDPGVRPLRAGLPVGLLATRVATHGDRRALRIVDYLGPADTVPALGALVLAQVRAIGAEYADVYNSGIDPQVFEQAGFWRVDPDGADIVPDHFEPFERRNIRVLFALKTPQPAVLFKGDADQDRPNRRSA